MTTSTGRQKEQTRGLSQQTCEQGREESNSSSSALIGRLGVWTLRIQSIVSDAFDATMREGGRGLSRGVAAPLSLSLSGPFPFCGTVGPFLLAVSLLVVQREGSYTVLSLSLATSWAQASCPPRPCLSAFGAQLPLCLSAAHTAFQSKNDFQISLFGVGRVQEV